MGIRSTFASLLAAAGLATTAQAQEPVDHESTSDNAPKTAEISPDQTALESGAAAVTQGARSGVDFMMDVLSWPVKKVGNIVSGTTDILGDSIQKVGDTLGDPIVTPTIARGVRGAGNLVDNTVSRTADLASGVVHSATDLTMDVVDATASLASGKPVRATDSLINSVSANTSDVVLGTATAVADEVSEIGGLVGDSIVTPTVANGVSGAGRWVGDTIDEAGNLASGVVHSVADLATDTVDATASLVTGKPLRAAQKVAGSVVENASEVVGSTVSAGANVLGNAANTVVDTSFDVAERVTSPVRHGLRDTLAAASKIGKTEQEKRIIDAATEVSKAASDASFSIPKLAVNGVVDSVQIAGNVVGSGLSIGGDIADASIRGDGMHFMGNTLNMAEQELSQVIDDVGRDKQTLENDISGTMDNLSSQPHFNTGSRTDADVQNLQRITEGVRSLPGVAEKARGTVVGRTLDIVKRVEMMADVANETSPNGSMASPRVPQADQSDKTPSATQAVNADNQVLYSAMLKKQQQDY